MPLASPSTRTCLLTCEFVHATAYATHLSGAFSCYLLGPLSAVRLCPVAMHCTSLLGVLLTRQTHPPLQTPDSLTEAIARGLYDSLEGGRYGSEAGGDGVQTGCNGVAVVLVVGGEDEQEDGGDPREGVDEFVGTGRAGDGGRAGRVAVVGKQGRQQRVHACVSGAFAWGLEQQQDGRCAHVAVGEEAEEGGGECTRPPHYRQQEQQQQQLPPLLEVSACCRTSRVHVYGLGWVCMPYARSTCAVGSWLHVTACVARAA